LQTEDEGGGSVGSRWPEVGVAVFLAVLAVLVITDSLRVGIGWADDGPRSGYFPFYIGVILLGASLWVVGAQLVRWRRSNPEFASREQLGSVFSVLAPIAVYVLAIRLLGIYLASALLITWFMWRHGKYRWVLTLPVAIGVPLLFFLVFERWFLVPLPKGPIEAALGF
jgi:putative tricarboxylic transport membrane protein